MVEAPQVLATLSDIMNFIAPNAGGTVPTVNSDEYNTWRKAIQVKYEEASRRGFWRRLLTKELIAVEEDDETILLPIRFQRANSLYILAVDGVDLADPDRVPDDQSIFIQQINDPDDENFGRWQINLETPISEDQDAVLWYFATPPIPTDPTDKVLLPGDMIAFGAMAEIFRTTNLEGSQDDARIEYENRLTNYLALEMIPSRDELLKFDTNPRRVDRTLLARQQYLTRPSRNRQMF
jgi:hypothetical protein